MIAIPTAQQIPPRLRFNDVARAKPKSIGVLLRLDQYARCVLIHQRLGQADQCVPCFCV